MEFLHNIVIFQFEFETANQQFNSFVITCNLGWNFSKNLIAGGVGIRMSWLENFGNIN